MTANYQFQQTHMNSSTPNKSHNPHQHMLPSPHSHSSQVSAREVEVKITELSQTIAQKNEIIEHLTERIRNQEQQIDMLITDAEAKHQHQIKKYYARSYEKYMKNGKYLLLRMEDAIRGEGIYLPKGVTIVHFGEIDGERMDNGVGKEEEASQGKIESEEPKGDLTLKDKKQSVKLETSCKGLSKQIQILKQKLKAYSQFVTASQPESPPPVSPQDNTAPQLQFSPQAKDAYIHDLEEQIKELQKSNIAASKQYKEKLAERKREDEEQARRNAERKGKHTSKTIFIRKY